MKEIEYVEIDGFLDLNLKVESIIQLNLTRFDRMRLNFLKEHYKIIYTNMLTNNTLKYSQSIDDVANQLYNKWYTVRFAETKQGCRYGRIQNWKTFLSTARNVRRKHLLM